MEQKKKKINSTWLIPACLFIGLGFGFLFGLKYPLAIPAFTLMGLGVGILGAFVFGERKHEK
jgi:hypothetical protein